MDEKITHEKVQPYEAFIQRADAINDTSKVQDLMEIGSDAKELGFENCAEAVETDFYDMMANEYKDAINYFNEKYPLCKFIPLPAIDLICEKYELVYGTADRYLGSIPKANLEEIKMFAIEEDDKVTESEYRMQEVMRNSSIFDEVNIFKFFKDKEYAEDVATKMHEDKSNRLHRVKYEPINGSFLEGLKKILTENVRGNVPKNFDKLHIAAPKNLMKGQDEKIVLDLDPIVIQPVLGGGLIITAWGEEAYDVKMLNKLI